MTKFIVKCTQEGDGGALRAVKAREAFIDGYQVAERLLEGVPIRIFHTDEGTIDAEIVLEKELIKSMYVNVEQVRAEVLDDIENGRFDVLASSAKLADDDMSIYDDALPPGDQAFGCAPGFELERG